MDVWYDTNVDMQKKLNWLLFIIILLAKRHALTCPSFRFFITLMFKNYKQYFFYEILILIQTKKNINVCYFQVIKNQINYDYLFQRRDNNTI